MEVYKKDLLSNLSILKPGIAIKDVVEEMTHYMFTGDYLFTYNEEMFVSIPFKTPFKATIKAKKLLDAVTKAKIDPLHLEYDKLGLLKLTTSDQEVGIHTGTNFDYLERANVIHKDLIDPKTVWEPIPKDLIEGMYICSLTTLTDDFQGRGLIGVMVEDKKVYGAQMYRCTSWELDEPVVAPFLIRASWARPMRKIDFTQYHVGDKWVSFKTESGIIYTVLIIGNQYPSDRVEEMLDVDGIRVRLPEEGLKEAASDCISWSEEELDYRMTISLTFEKNLVTCRASDEYGYIVKKVPTEYDKEPINILISPVFLMEILDKGVRSMTVTKEHIRVGFHKDRLSHALILNVKESK